MRLCQILLKKVITRNSNVYALFALMCFHSSRLESKLDTNNEVMDLKTQDRSKWYFPLIKLGNNAMNKAVEDDSYSVYHFEAAIACEHLKAKTFEETNWNQILHWYELLHHINPVPSNLINMAMVQLQLNKLDDAHELLKKVDEQDLGTRNYLYHGAYAEYYLTVNDTPNALSSLDKALNTVKNETEKRYLQKKKDKLLPQN